VAGSGKLHDAWNHFSVIVNAKDCNAIFIAKTDVLVMMWKTMKWV